MQMVVVVATNGNDADDDDEKMCINREANGGIMTQSADERVNT